MQSTAFSLMVFAIIFGGALLGILLGRKLPQNHLNVESKDVVKVAIGLVGTMVALILGLLIASGKSFHDAQEVELTQMSAKIVMLDRVLAHYGSETLDTRRDLRQDVVRVLDLMSPPDAKTSAQQPIPSFATENVYDKLQGLSPNDAAHRLTQSQALSIALDLGNTRWLMFAQRTTSISTFLLAILIFWLTIIFISFGLFAPSNMTTLTALSVSSFSVSMAIFLLLELYSPYKGWIQVSRAPLRAALDLLGR